MTSTPQIQIAYALLGASAKGDELKRQAQELARLVQPGDVCKSCWRLYSNGTRGKTQHEPEHCALEA